MLNSAKNSSGIMRWNLTKLSFKNPKNWEILNLKVVWVARVLTKVQIFLEIKVWN